MARKASRNADEPSRLGRLNLAVHSLDGETKHGDNINSYHDDPHDAIGRFDFVFANPPSAISPRLNFR